MSSGFVYPMLVRDFGGYVGWPEAKAHTLVRLLVPPNWVKFEQELHQVKRPVLVLCLVHFIAKFDTVGWGNFLTENPENV